jgi:hypothetical protein
MSLVQPQVIQQGNNYHVQHGTDAGLYVEFYTQAIQDEEETTKQGRPIFNDVDFIKIIPVGDKNTIVCRPVKHTADANTPPDTIRWANQWAAFKAQKEQPVSGTPVTEWAPLTKSQAMMLKGVHIHTVEALAEVSDANLNNIGMGARELRDKAKAFLAQAAGGAGVSKLVEENKDLRIKLEAMQNQLNALASNVKVKKNGKDTAATDTSVCE